MFASWICEGIPEPTASPAEALMLILPSPGERSIFNYEKAYTVSTLLRPAPMTC